MELNLDITDYDDLLEQEKLNKSRELEIKKEQLELYHKFSVKYSTQLELIKIK